MYALDKLPSGRFRARVDLGTDADGKRIRKTIIRQTEAAAKLAAADLVATIPGSNHRGMAYDAVRFDVAMREWLLGKSDIRPRTRKGYHYSIEKVLIPQFGTRLLGQMTEREIRNWLADYLPGRTTTTLRQYFIPMKAMLDDFLRARSPAANIPLPKQQKFRCQPPTPDEMRAVMAMVNGTPDELYVALFSGGGIRLGEICGLTYRAALAIPGRIIIEQTVTFGLEPGIVIDDPKSERGFRSLAVDSTVQEIIWNMLVSRNFDKSSPDDIPEEVWNERIYSWRPDSLSKRFHDILAANAQLWDFKKRKRIAPNMATFERGGIKYSVTDIPVKPFRAYDMRHHHASSLLAAGVPDAAAALRLGHDVNTLQKNYQHLFPDFAAETDAMAVQLMQNMRAVKPLVSKDHKGINP